MTVIDTQKSDENQRENEKEAKRKDRHARLLCCNGLPSERTSDYEICPAYTEDELLAAYRLVHDNYVQRGYILPEKSGVRLRIFEALPEMATFIAKTKKEGKIVGVLSSFDGTSFRLPSEFVFGEEIATLRKDGRRICEFTNWAIAKEYRRTPMAMELGQVAIAQALAVVKSDDIVVSVSPRAHETFFKLLRFQQFGSIRNFSNETEDLVVMMRLNCLADMEPCSDADDLTDQSMAAILRKTMRTTNPYIERVVAWSANTKKMFKNPEFLWKIFVRDGNLLPRCTAKDLLTIQESWGNEVFNQVVSHK